MTNVSVSLVASVLLTAVWFYVLSPLYTRSVIRSAFKEVDGQKLGETKFVPVLGEFAAVSLSGQAWAACVRPARGEGD